MLSQDVKHEMKKAFLEAAKSPHLLKIISIHKRGPVEVNRWHWDLVLIPENLQYLKEVNDRYSYEAVILGNPVC